MIDDLQINKPGASRADFFQKTCPHELLCRRRKFPERATILVWQKI